MIVPFIEQHAITVITILLLVFAGLFLLLFLYTTINRYVYSLQIEKEKQTEEWLEPLLFLYLDGQVSFKEFSTRLHSYHELTVAYRIINIMIDNISGPESEKLQKLLELNKFKTYFYKKLRSHKPMKMAQACMYFSQKSRIDPKSIKRLTALQSHSYNVIAYASTLALINSNNHHTRDEALQRYLHRSHNASMAVNDIIFKYYSKYSDKFEASEKLMFYIMDSKIPEKTNAAVIAMFPGFGFYQYTDDLSALLQRVIPADQTGILTSTLLKVLFELSHEHIILGIESFTLWRSPFTSVRLQVAQILSEEKNPRFKDILLRLGHDPDLEVRIVSQQALLNMEQINLDDLQFTHEVRGEWEEMKRSRGEYVYSF